MNVLLPALGNPTSATSAMSFSSSLSQRSVPSSPCSQNRGARRRFDRNLALPRPPRPPSAASQRSPWRTRSASTSPVYRSRATVPSGTVTTWSWPVRPCMSLPLPCTPSPPRRCGWSRNARSEATLRSATSQTSPPLPPSPPLGPPLTTGPSRRKLTQPAPPSPPRTFSWHSSTNPDMARNQGTGEHGRAPLPYPGPMTTTPCAAGRA